MSLEMDVSSMIYRSKGRKANKFYPLKTASTSQFCGFVFSGEKNTERRTSPSYLLYSNFSNAIEMPHFVSST